MISRVAAVQFCAQSFPGGPERLAESLGIKILGSPLQGTEGWCITGVNTIIRLNSDSSRFRQRFTLAHELAHLVLGTKPDIASEPFRSNSQEERDADKLASEFLLPDRELTQYIRGELPVDARTLERLAKAANVSPVVAACRVVSSTSQLGLPNAALVFFADGIEQWRYTQGLRFDERAARQLHDEALAKKPQLVRGRNTDGNIVVGSIIDAQCYQVLLVQLLPPETAGRQTQEERLNVLVDQVFNGDQSFRQSVAGTLGIVKKKCHGQRLDQAVSFFEQEYLAKKYCGDREARLRSAAGREYIRLHLGRWFN